jgi:sporulation-control protein spo0M
MGFFDKIKSAVNAVTGGAAKVAIEFQPAVAYPGDPVKVKITATSTGGEVKSKGIFVDLRGLEEVKARITDSSGTTHNHNESKSTFESEFKISPDFVLAANETKTFEGSVTIPTTAQPSYEGVNAVHKWEIRGRVEALGNDPDSGFKPLRIGVKA